jgi:hypothetical protein
VVVRPTTPVVKPEPVPEPATYKPKATPDLLPTKVVNMCGGSKVIMPFDMDDSCVYVCSPSHIHCPPHSTHRPRL